MVAATGILGGFIAVGLVTPVPRVLCVGTENHINWAAVGSLELLTRADRCKPHGALTFDLSFSFSLRSPLLSPSPLLSFFFLYSFPSLMVSALVAPFQCSSAPLVRVNSPPRTSRGSLGLLQESQRIPKQFH